MKLAPNMGPQVMNRSNTKARFNLGVFYTKREGIFLGKLK